VKTPSKSDPPQARKPYTPQATQNRILMEHLNGKSNRQIAKITGRYRGTVSRILAQRDMVEIIEEQRSRLVEMAPKVVSVIGRTLDSSDRGLRHRLQSRSLSGQRWEPPAGTVVETLTSPHLTSQN
jgi:hypothetical protein